MGTALALLTGVLLFTLFWLDGARARELATALARAMCERHQLQLLDETVVLRRLGLDWSGRGLRFRRMFDFEFSLGGGRRQGYLILVGTGVEQYGLDLPETPDPGAQVPDRTTPDREGDKVVPFRRPRQR